MENNEIKYFTPAIEDIRVGYECEVLMMDKKWHPFKYGEHDFSVLSIELLNNQIRVPYLTKEQIEAEGWKYIARGTDLWFEKEGRFQIGSWTSYKIVLHYGEHDQRLYIDSIDTGDRYPLFEGQCRDINDFRWICKKLGI